jgi:hypothetical protein
MSDKWIPFIITTLILALLGFAAYTNLEVYPTTVHRGPSRQYAANDYFMLEKWLGRTGRPVRTLGEGNVSRIVGSREKVVLILQPEYFDWEGAAEELEPWMEAGGWLLVSMESAWDEDLQSFIQFFSKRFGITVKFTEDPFLEKNADDDRPDFSPLVHFRLREAAREQAVTMWGERGDNGELIRLVQIPIGEGGIAAFGPPLFMRNSRLDREANARLAWDLTGARTGKDHPGILVFRWKEPVKGLFGKLADRGNLLPLGVSLVLLIIVGFWMVIPVFGLVFEEKPGPGRPIRDRFLAETRFLKRYRGLHLYLEVYIQEIRRKLRGREADGEMEAIERSLQKKRPPSYRETVRFLRILENIEAVSK